MTEQETLAAIGGAVVAAATAGWKFRASAWKGIVMLAIAIAKEDCQKKLTEMEERWQAKVDVLIDALAGTQERAADITAKMRAVKAPSQPPDKPEKQRR